MITCFFNLLNLLTMKYYDLEIASLDLEYIEELADAYWIDRRDLEIDVYWDVTNSILFALLCKIAENEVEDYEDRTKIQASIYTNCLDSGYDILDDDLETEQAKEFINNF